VEIAERFEAANAEAIEYVLGPAALCWESVTAIEGWPVGVVARHIGLGHELMTGWAHAIKSRTPVTRVDDIHAVNAAHAARGIVATPEQVAELLRTGGVMVATALRALTDDDLDGEVHGDHTMPAAMLADASLRHVQGHLASIRETVEAAASS
jgi:hypothetical protein